MRRAVWVAVAAYPIFGCLGLLSGAALYCVVVKRYSVQMPDELVDALEGAALRSRRSVSAEIVVAVEQALDGLAGRDPRRLLQGAAGETPPGTATDTSQGREVTPEGELKNEAPTRAYSAPRPASPSSSQVTPDWRGGKP